MNRSNTILKFENNYAKECSNDKEKIYKIKVQEEVSTDCSEKTIFQHYQDNMKDNFSESSFNITFIKQENEKKSENQYDLWFYGLIISNIVFITLCILISLEFLKTICSEKYLHYTFIFTFILLNFLFALYYINKFQLIENEIKHIGVLNQFNEEEEIDLENEENDYLIKKPVPNQNMYFKAIKIFDLSYSAVFNFIVINFIIIMTYLYIKNQDIFYELCWYVKFKKSWILLFSLIKPILNSVSFIKIENKIQSFFEILLKFTEAVLIVKIYLFQMNYGYLNIYFSLLLINTSFSTLLDFHEKISSYTKVKPQFKNIIKSLLLCLLLLELVFLQEINEFFYLIKIITMTVFALYTLEIYSLISSIKSIQSEIKESKQDLTLSNSF